MSEKIKNTKARFKLRSVFLFVNLTVLFLPLFGVIFFRFYENQLVKQTETELISQAAVFSAIYKENIKEELGPNLAQYGTPLGNEMVAAFAEEEYYNPVSPQVDLFAGDILPPRPDGVAPQIGDIPTELPPTQYADARDPIRDEDINGETIIASRPREETTDTDRGISDKLEIAGIMDSDAALAPAPAPTPAPPPTPRARKLGDDEDVISVVGSRVKGRTALDSNVPEDVIIAADLTPTPSLNLKDAITAEPNEDDELMDIVDESVDVVKIDPQVIEDEAAFKVGAKMLPIIIDAQKTTLSGIKILDYNGIAVAGRNEIGLNFSLLSEIETALTGEYTSLMRERVMDAPTPAIASISRGTGIRLFVAFPIIENNHLWGVVYLSRTPQNILKHIYSNKEKMTLIGVSLLGLTLLLALLTSYTVSKPLNRLIGRVKRFTEGEMEAIEPMTSPGVVEIEQLSESFSNMASALNNRADYIREFAMSVSHEFKTPITSIQGSAELLMEHIDDMDQAKKEKFLANIITDSDRLKRLINRLLELARADNFKPKNEKTSLLQSLNDLKSRYNDLNVTINLDKINDHQVLIAKEHFETILTNLFDNAMQHDAHNITVTNQSQYGFISLIINDDGSGISDANSTKIFDSFFTTKRENGGTGLGLGIVSSLLSAHNGAIELIPSEQGATFKITLPVAIDQDG